MRGEDYQSLTRGGKMKQILPKVLPLLLLSVILPTVDVGTDLALITRLFTGVGLCVDKERDKFRKCEEDKAEQYCISVCGVSHYYCDQKSLLYNEYLRCEEELGPDQYCTPEIVSNKSNTVCRMKDRSPNSPARYFCRHYKIWSSDWKDYEKCSVQTVDKFCLDANNTNVCYKDTHPLTAGSLLFFFLLNYVMGLVTCVRLEGRNWFSLIAALFNVYPQYCKK